MPRLFFESVKKFKLFSTTVCARIRKYNLEGKVNDQGKPSLYGSWGVHPSRDLKPA